MLAALGQRLPTAFPGAYLGSSPSCDRPDATAPPMAAPKLIPRAMPRPTFPIALPSATPKATPRATPTATGEFVEFSSVLFPGLIAQTTWQQPAEFLAAAEKLERRPA